MEKERHFLLFEPVFCVKTGENRLKSSSPVENPVETVEKDPMTPDMLPDTEPDAARVVAAAVYLHGMTGGLAAEALTKEGVMAGDLIEYLPEAICRIRQENEKSESFEYTKRQA